jgi:hypothetical protein
MQFNEIVSLHLSVNKKHAKDILTTVQVIELLKRKRAEQLEARQTFHFSEIDPSWLASDFNFNDFNFNDFNFNDPSFP